MKNRPLHARLGFAAAGLAAGWRRERSFRTQAVVAACVAIALAVLRPAPFWWAIAAVTVALVLALELVNSALEAVIDLLHPDVHPEVKAAKDMLAGAVLAISLASLVVAGTLLVDLLPDRLAEWGIWP